MLYFIWLLVIVVWSDSNVMQLSCHFYLINKPFKVRVVIDFTRKHTHFQVASGPLKMNRTRMCRENTPTSSLASKGSIEPMCRKSIALCLIRTIGWRRGISGLFCKGGGSNPLLSLYSINNNNKNNNNNNNLFFKNYLTLHQN